MPSDSNGVYSLPAGYLAVTGDTIQASQHNPPLEDIASSLTARLMRSGAAPMTGVFKSIDGTAAAPGIQFLSGGGFYRTDSGIGVSYAGAKVGEFVAGGYTGSAVDLTISGHLTATATDYMKIPIGTTAQRPAEPVDGQFRLNSTIGVIEVYTNAQWNGLSFGFLQPFQCQLVKDSTNLRLNRNAGKYIFINGVSQEIPLAGVALSPSGLIAATTYYVYAYMSSGTMTLEASTTAPATDSTYGHAIKNGDATRSLVGQARTNGSIAWVDSATQRWVRSYYNDPGVTFVNTFTTSRATGSTAYVELNSEIRVEGLFWADDLCSFSIAGGATTSGDGDNFTTAFGIDGTTAETPQQNAAAFTGRNSAVSLSLHKSGLTAGLHYVTLLGKTSTGSATWLALTSLAGSARRPS